MTVSSRGADVLGPQGFDAKGFDAAGFDPDGIDAERTVVVRGRAAASEWPDGDGEVEIEVDRTIVVERPGEADRTVVVERGGAFDETVVVIRPGTDAPSGHVPADEADEADRTVVVRRAADAESEADADADRTVVVVDRVHQAPEAEAAPLRTSRRVRSTKRRRALQPAPLDPATLRPARPGAGAGAIDAYPVRPVRTIAAASAPPLGVDADEPTRATDADLPSLARRSRRRAVGSVVAVAATGVFSVAGLVTLGVLALAG
ncbi:hypothetical protein GE115_17795 [Agromyces sp. CFH 90414]|uniref:Uncharacterized protein n=1 Tax=Agromyces agglutinans TaxID=2662258 RepID=A0A6I2F8D5_9MICO|nr:hypothetical protein [Agromyces agglutinans]MRG61715.1 hypothetical protein [Agromyces agglutinans]